MGYERAYKGEDQGSHYLHTQMDQQYGHVVGTNAVNGLELGRWRQE